MMDIIIYIIIFLVNLLFIPLLWWILKKIEAVLFGKKWPNILQQYYDLLKLLKKQDFKSEFTSFISFLAPIVILTVSIIFLFFSPIINTSISINIIVLFHLLWLWSFFLILYWMDNSTYFGWLWASREAFVLAIMEPIFLLLLAGVVVISNGSLDTSSIYAIFSKLWSSIGWILIMILFALVFFAIFLAENKRFPFDNPSTHLELTMIHEAMLLESSWKTLFILELASKIIMFAFINLFIYLFLPFTFGIENIFLLFLLWFIKVLVVLFFIWLFEVLITKMRLFKYQNVFLFLLVLLFVSFIFYFIN